MSGTDEEATSCPNEAVDPSGARLLLPFESPIGLLGRKEVKQFHPLSLSSENGADSEEAMGPAEKIWLPWLKSILLLAVDGYDADLPL